MDKTVAEAFGNYRPSNNPFTVTGYALKPVRGWRHDPLKFSEGDAQNWTRIYGMGMSLNDKVTVISLIQDALGLDVVEHVTSEVFELRIWSSRDGYSKSWIPQAPEHLSHDCPEHELLRRRFDAASKIPPTAMLFAYSDAEMPPALNWRLQCELPETLISSLADAIAAGSINSVNVEIHWVGGIARGDTWGGKGETWGILKIGKEEPEPLYGYVAGVHWTPGQQVSMPYWPEDQLSRVCESWLKRFKQNAKDGDKWKKRTEDVISQSAEQITRQCRHDEDMSPNILKARLDDTLDFFLRLDEALHMPEGPFQEETAALWQHRDILKIFKSKKSSERQYFVDRDALRRSIREYVSNTWLYESYIDWVLVDASVCAATIGELEYYYEQKYPISYAISSGVRWKFMALRPLAWFVKLLYWIIPATVSYGISQWSLRAAIVTGVIWYGIEILLLIVRFSAKALLMLRAGGTPTSRLRNAIDEMAKAYGSLRGEILHVGNVRKALERAAEKGAVWDEEIFYLLDRLDKQNGTPWYSFPRPGLLLQGLLR